MLPENSSAELPTGCARAVRNSNPIPAPKAPHRGENVYQQDELSPLKEGALAAPELEALCADLTTATNINRALAQTFLLLAQGPISRRDAVAFGYLSQLLLQTLPAIRREFIDAFGSSVYDAKLRIRLGSSSRANNVSEGSLRDQQTGPQPPLNKVQSKLSPQPDEPAPPREAPNVAQPAKEPVLARSNDISRPSAPPPVPSPESLKIGRAPDGAFAGAAAVKNTSEPPVIRTATAVSPPAPAVAASASPPPKAPAISSQPAAMRAPKIPARPPETSAAPSPLNNIPSPAPSRAVATPGTTLDRTGHTADWFVPASWSKTGKPDPFPSRADKLQRELRSMSNYRLRHLQHLNSRGF